ncbi:hypothetical protein D3C71_1647400 [compost metagenome]
MVIAFFDDDLVQLFVIANFTAKDYPGVVQIIALGGMDTTHFAFGTLCVDPILIRAVPAQLDATDFNVVQVGLFLRDPGP